jgi:predicted nucleotidyltransferase
MQVSSNDTLAGIPLIDIRNFLRRYPKGCGFTVSSIEDELGVASSQAGLIAQAMTEAGFIEPMSERETGGHDASRYYSRTKFGSRLCATRFVKRITRAKADALVKQMLERIAEINARDELVFRIKRVRAFGSYASDAPEVGDIDLAVDLEQRYPEKDIIEQLLARAKASGKCLNSYMDRLNYAETEVERLLKGRSPYLAIEGANCPEKFGLPTIQLFPDPQKSQQQTVDVGVKAGGAPEAA